MATTEKVDYSKNETPVFYKCAKCGATHCKLWRVHNSVPVNLLCAKCASVVEGKSIASLDRWGTCLNSLGSRTDKIGDHVPAIPVEDNSTYWGYSSIPSKAYSWWANLPTFSSTQIKTTA